MSPLELVIYAIFVAMVWSSLYRTTWVFHIAENLIIGLYFGFTLYNGVDVINRLFWTPVIVRGGWYNVAWLGVILGLLSWTRFSKKTAFINKWVLAYITAIGVSLAVIGAIRAQIIQQLVIKPWDISNISLTVNQIITIIVTISVMIYFTFSFKLTGPVKGVARVGRLFFMVMLGTLFGTNMVTNFGVPVGVAYTVSQTPAIYIMIVGFIIILIDIIIRRQGIRIKSPFG